MGVLRIKAEDLDRVVGQTLEAPKNHLGLEGDGLVGSQHLALERAYCPLNLLHLLQNLGAAGRADTWLVLEGLGDVVHGPAANVRETVHTLQLRVQKHLLGKAVMAGNVEGRTVNADTVEDLDRVV